MDRPDGINVAEMREAKSGNEIVDALVLDLVEWVAHGERSYTEVMEAWRTSCPRLPVWEDANHRGFIASHHEDGAGIVVTVTPLGRDFLDRHRPSRSTRARE